MGEVQAWVKEFHETFAPNAVSERPSMPNVEAAQMRLRLIAEELEEVTAEMEHYYGGRQNQQDALVNLAQELADLLYVVYGTGVTLGLDLDAVVALVHEANMTKTWPVQDLEDAPEGASGVITDHGTVLYREDGKVLKPPSFKPVLRSDVEEALGLTQTRSDT